MSVEEPPRPILSIFSDFLNAVFGDSDNTNEK